MSTWVLLCACFVASMIAALLITPPVRALARAFGIVASPRDDRWNRREVALLGGVAVFLGCLTGISVIVFVMERPVLAGSARAHVGIVAAAAFMFFAGLADDRYKVRPATKLILQSVAAAVLISFGVVYPISPWPAMNMLFTFLWFLALTNALNLLDNMDGVAVGVAAIASLFLALTFWREGAVTLTGLCLALAGAAIGFLRYNFSPASIFMGDSGSLFVGALLAGLGAAYPANAAGSIVSVLFVPFFIVLIPILDTGLVTMNRLLAGRPISAGGRDHTTHRLVAIGLSERQTAFLLYAFATIGGATALGLINRTTDYGPWVGMLFLLSMLVLAAYLSRMHKYEKEPHLRPGRVTVLVTDLLYKRRALEVILDLALFTAAYQGAYLLRYDGVIPVSQSLVLERTLAIVVVAKSVAFGLLGVYRGAWRQMSNADVQRLFKATVLGSLFALGATVFFYREAEFARSIFVLDAVLLLLLSIGVRISFRWLDSLRKTFDGGEPSLIYGAGRSGELVLREIQSNRSLRLRPIGFIDDDTEKHRTLLHGLPVCGGLERLSEVLRSREVRHVIISARNLPVEREEDIARCCHALGVGVFRLHLELRPISRLTGTAAVAERRIEVQVPERVSARTTI